MTLSNLNENELNRSNGFQNGIACEESTKPIENCISLFSYFKDNISIIEIKKQNRKDLENRYMLRMFHAFYMVVVSNRELSTGFRDVLSARDCRLGQLPSPVTYLSSESKLQWMQRVGSILISNVCLLAEWTHLFSIAKRRYRYFTLN